MTSPSDHREDGEEREEPHSRELHDAREQSDRTAAAATAAASAAAAATTATAAAATAAAPPNDAPDSTRHRPSAAYNRDPPHYDDSNGSAPRVSPHEDRIQRASHPMEHRDHRSARHASPSPPNTSSRDCPAFDDHPRRHSDEPALKREPHHDSPHRPVDRPIVENGDAAHAHDPHPARSHTLAAPEPRAAPGHAPPGADMHRFDDPDAERAAGASDRYESGAEPVNLFVRNVAKHVTEQQLLDLFGKYGKVDSTVVVRDPHSQECRGFGFVKMVYESDAVKVLDAFQDFEFEGRRIAVERAKRKSPHSRTPGAYMGADRRIRDRYSGMKRSRDYETGYAPGYNEQYAMPRRSAYRGRHPEDSRGWYEGRGAFDPRDSRMAARAPSDDRERFRRRYDEPRAERNYERDNRYRDREPPVPREPTDDVV